MCHNNQTDEAAEIGLYCSCSWKVDIPASEVVFMVVNWEWCARMGDTITCQGYYDRKKNFTVKKVVLSEAT